MKLNLLLFFSDEAYSQWAFFASDTASKRDAAMTMVKRLLNKVVFGAFMQWQAWAHETAANREKAQTMVRRLLNQ